MFRRISFSVAAIALVVLSLAVSPVSAAGGIGLSPSSGPPGTPVNLTGSGFTSAGTSCDVYWSSILLGTTVIDGNLNVSFNFTVPTDATIGGNTVSLLCANQQDNPITSFDVLQPPPPATPNCQQMQNCTPVPPAPTRTCQQRQNCTPVPPTPTKTCEQLHNCTPIPPTPTTPCTELNNCTPTPTSNTPVPNPVRSSPTTAGDAAGMPTETPNAAGAGEAETPPAGPELMSNPGILITGGFLGILIIGVLVFLGLKLLGGIGSDDKTPGGREDIGPKHDDLLTSGREDIGPKHDDLLTSGREDIGPKHDDLLTSGREDIGPKHDDLLTENPEGTTPKHDPIPGSGEGEIPGRPGGEGDPQAFEPAGDHSLVNDQDISDPGGMSHTGLGHSGGSPADGEGGFVRPGSEGDPHASGPG
jgi:hypothetical protein